MSDMKSLSRLKRAGKLRFWRGTIEINEQELHEICNEIQAEYDLAEAAINKAAGNWAKADAKLRENQDTRWHELFGTPERAARTLEKQCDPHHCVVCPAYHRAPCDEGDYDALLEWLRGDAE